MNLNGISLVVGLDWAAHEHVCCLREPGGNGESIERVGAKPEIFGPWLDRLRQEHAAGSIAVILERPDGAVVHMLRSRPGIIVVAVNPSMLHRFRQAFCPSGAKDDPSDASLLSELLVRHPEKLHPLVEGDGPVRTLAALTRHRRELIGQRTFLVQKLKALLKEYYPQALELAGEELASPLARAFLKRWPDLCALKRAHWSAVERLYRHHNCGRPSVLAQRRQLISEAVVVSSDPSYLKVCRLQLEALLAQFGALAPVIEHYDKVIVAEYSKAPGHEVIDSLPGAGPAMAPRLWVACVQAGSDSAAVNLAQASGIAPVQRQSGRARSICFRRARSLFLHQSWLEFAYHSLAGSRWAREFYKRRKAAGHGNNAVLRALAFKWIRIVARIWHDKVPYDETYYLEHLKTRPVLT
jgi:transposase